MRARIAAEKGTTDIWDLKQVRGGLVDLEFIVQYLQLVKAHDDPQILDTNTADSICKLTAAKLLSEADGDDLGAAAQLFHNLAGQLRLLADGPFDPVSAPRGLKQRLARAAAAPSFSALEALVKDAQALVYAAFERLI